MNTLDELVCSLDVCPCSGTCDECACRPPELRSISVCLDCCAILELPLESVTLQGAP